MKTYEVEFRYTSYTIVTVEAESQEEAERRAMQELSLDGDYRSSYGEWLLESIEEIEE